MIARDDRHKVMMTARMLDGQQWADVTIRDVSEHGLGLSARTPPITGSYVEVRRAARVIGGRVAWTRDRFFGIQTSAPVDVRAVLFDTAHTGRGVSDRRITPRAIETAVEEHDQPSTTLSFETMALAVLAMLAAIIAVASFLR